MVFGEFARWGFGVVARILVGLMGVIRRRAHVEADEGMQDTSRIHLTTAVTEARRHSGRWTSGRVRNVKGGYFRGVDVFILASGTMTSRSEMLSKTVLPPEKGGCIV